MKIKIGDRMSINFRGGTVMDRMESDRMESVRQNRGERRTQTKHGASKSK